MKIYLVQPTPHVSSNFTDSVNFEIQALARRMLSNKINIGRIYVNGNDISQKTGSILSKILHVPVFRDDRFSEVNKNVIFGNFENIDFQNLENINLFIEEIVDKNNDVVITIGEGVHRVIISKLTGMSLTETRHFYFQNAGISVLHYDNATKIWRINSINDVNHLRFP